VNANLSPRIAKSKDRSFDLKKYFDNWNLARNINEAKQLVLDDQAIKGNDNVNKDVFDSYVERISNTLINFLNNRESFFLSNAHWFCVF